MMPRDNGSPLVSIIVTQCREPRFTEAAVLSALRQTIRGLEVIVAMTCAPDDQSTGPLESLAREDNRLRLIHVPVAEAVASHQNRCLDIARGQWVTFMAGGDLLHPARIERLLAMAERHGADIVCDNVLIFDDNNQYPPALAVTAKFARTHTRIDVGRYLGFLAPRRGNPEVRCLRPLMRLELIRRGGIRYDPDLRDLADFDFSLALLIHGACFWWSPVPTYFHRLSERIAAEVLAPRIRGMFRPRERLTPGQTPDPGLAAVLEKHAAGINAILHHVDRPAEGPRQRALGYVDAIVWQTSRVLTRFGRISGALRRQVVARPHAEAAGHRHVCIISRQRVVGRTTGSSSYLIGLATAIAGRGFRMHLVCPSPDVFGRLPVLILRPEMAVFSSISIRGSFRMGNFVVAAHPTVGLRAIGAVLGRLLATAGLRVDRLTKPAPYSIRQPWRVEDFLYLARHARRHADVILADYAFLTDGIPYVLRPDAASAVIMHDLLSSRAAQYGPLGMDAATASIDLATEMKLLGQADAVVAIQAAEATVVRHQLPRHGVILAPLAADPVSAPQPGQGAELLFVGSKTTANIDGLNWFISEVWPTIRAAAPHATLLVAGAVGEMFATVPPGIRLLGLVPDLTPLYTSAAIVISPLRGGSGLKIKLIEAMAQGKAIVATSTTLQGVEDIARPVMRVADDPTGFAAAVVDLLGDTKSRSWYAEAALGVARSQFSAEACYAELFAFLERPEAPRRCPSVSSPPRLGEQLEFVPRATTGQ